MLKDNHNSLSNIPNPSFKKETINDKIIHTFEETLYKFQEQFKGEVNSSEENLNEQLGKTLSYFSKNQPFIFQAETKQKQPKGIDRRVDIGVFKHFAAPNPFFTIEAKRLTSSIPKNREKEYVLGNDSVKLSGGIERFKHNVHGVNLDHSAIIGYVQNEDSIYWYNAINNWIQELIDGKIKSALGWISNNLLNNTVCFNGVRL